MLGIKIGIPVSKPYYYPGEFEFNLIEKVVCKIDIPKYTVYAH